MRIGEALRQRGFDEHMIADSYVDVAGRLRGKSDRTGGVEKLLVDVLKEVSRLLDPPRSADRPGSRAGASVQVQLIHSVARPERGVVLNTGAAPPALPADSSAPLNGPAVSIASANNASS